MKFIFKIIVIFLWMLCFSCKAQHSLYGTKYELSIFFQSDGAEKVNKGDLKAASKNGKYVSLVHKKEVQKKSNWAGGDTKSSSGLRVFKSVSDVKKSNPTDSKKLKL